MQGSYYPSKDGVGSVKKIVELHLSLTNKGLEDMVKRIMILHLEE
jgi:hypothetical protein